MHIVLFGATDLTQAVADFLYHNHYTISAIVTTPPVFKISYKPEGVKNTRYVDLAAWAEPRGIPVITYENSIQLEQALQKTGPLDLGLVVGWYHMVNKKIRDLFSVACVGFHASLLPKLRGGAPLSWAILTNQPETGVSFFELSDGVDDGLLYAQEKFPILSTDTVTELVKKAELAIMDILRKELLNFKDNKITKYQQQGTPSYCGQRSPEDSLINWSESSEDVLRLIRASTHPYAGAYSFLGDNKVIIWHAELCPDFEIYGIPGQIVYATKDTYIVACGSGAIKIMNPETSAQLKTHLRFSSKKV